MAGSDFVMVQLTPAGEALADGHVLGINAGRRSFVFKPGVAIRVERSYEWRVVLAAQHTPDGQLLCELVPDSTPAAPSNNHPEEETH